MIACVCLCNVRRSTLFVSAETIKSAFLRNATVWCVRVAATSNESARKFSMPVYGKLECIRTFAVLYVCDLCVCMRAFRKTVSHFYATVGVFNLGEWKWKRDTHTRRDREKEIQKGRERVRSRTRETNVTERKLSKFHNFLCTGAMCRCLCRFDFWCIARYACWLIHHLLAKYAGTRIILRAARTQIFLFIDFIYMRSEGTHN